MARRPIPATHFPAATITAPEAPPAETIPPANETIPAASETQNPQNETMPPEGETSIVPAGTPGDGQGGGEPQPNESPASESPAATEPQSDESADQADEAAPESLAVSIGQTQVPIASETHFASAQPDRDLPGCRMVRLGLPLKQSTGFAPQSIVMTLRPKDARTLADFAEGLRTLGVKISHPADAIKRLLEAMGEARAEAMFDTDEVASK